MGIKDYRRRVSEKHHRWLVSRRGESIAIPQARIQKTMEMIVEYMGPDMKVIRPGVPGKSDLILESADGY